MLIVLVSTGCAQSNEVDVTMEAPESVTQLSTQVVTENTLEISTEVITIPYTEVTTEVTTQAAVQKTTQAATQEITQETTAAPKPIVEVIGTTDKGYIIEQIDGVTYVEGVLIANKTYALPENYAPGDDATALAAFEKMQAAAANEALDIHISSGFRSYETQRMLYNAYIARDGQAAADRFSARAGHSEHQSGLAFDLNSVSMYFASTPECPWVAAHAHEYGFIVRYAKEKESITGYMYEPWHIRYVGEELAKEIYELGLSLEEYFGIDSSYKE